MTKCTLHKAFAAGLLICMGCIAFLKMGGGLAGAVVFSAGLWFVVNFDAELFTGRVTQDRYPVLQRLIMLCCNLLAAALAGYLASLALPEIIEPAQRMMEGYAAAHPLAVFLRAMLCGVCMYLATTRAGDGSRLPFVVYGVVLFILSGYAHSIALAGYAGAAHGIAWWVIPAAAAGNAAGSYLIKGLLTGRLIDPKP